MLEEIIGLALSICSLFAADTPRVRSNSQTLLEDTNFEIENEAEQSFINKEYEDNYGETVLENFLRTGSSPHLTNFDGCRNNGKVLKTFWKCLRTNLSIIIASIFPIGFAIMLVYVSINTVFSCMELWRHNMTEPFVLKRVELFGDSVLWLIVSLWFPLTMIILFGWKEFKAKYFSTIFIAVIISEFVVIIKLILFQFNVSSLYGYYMYISYFMFWTLLLSSTFVILNNIRAGRPSISCSKFHISALVLIQFIFCILLSYVYLYVIIHGFLSVRRNLYKFLIATSSPLLTFIPALLCFHMALRRSSEIIQPGRSFVLVYVIRGAVIFVYRTMQTNFKSIWIFIGLSLFSAVLNFLKKATKQIRFNMWKRLVSTLKKNSRCFQRLQVLPWNTAHARRLKADLEIQDILFEYNTLVLSQAFFIFYQLQNFDIATLPLLYELLKRIAIGVSIDFIFNCLSIFMQMYYYNIPIGRVWNKFWKRHLSANIIVVVVIIAHMGGQFAAVIRWNFQLSGDTKSYVVRICSLF